MKKWQKIYSRPTRTQDFDITIILPLFYLSKGSIKEMIYTPYKGKWDAWFPEEDWNKYIKILGSSVFKTNWSLKKHLNKFHSEAKNLRQAADILQQTSFKASKAELLKNYKNLMLAYRNYGLFIWFPWSIVYFLEDWFINKLKKYKNWREIYEALAKPTKATETDLMIEEIWKWRMSGGKNKDLSKITKRFAFLGAYSVNDKVWKSADILKQAGDLRNCREKLEQAKKARGKNKLKIKKALQALKKQDKLLAKVAEIIHEYIWLRTQRVDEYKRAMVTSQPFYRRLEKEFGWKFGWAGHLTYQEIICSLKNNKPPVRSRELAERDKLQYICHIRKDSTKIIADVRQREEYLKKIMGNSYSVNSAQKLAGRIAYPGKMRGRVKIILKASDCSKLKQGEILVANMTHPDYIIAIRKAGAIVTDEGGIVCHAAIISRELKILCIIGTKIATKVLKDGDLVEVDANNGIVRKL